MSTPNYTDEDFRQRTEARLRALAIAHEPTARPDEVVARAKAYVAFVEAE